MVYWLISGWKKSDFNAAIGQAAQSGQNNIFENL